MQGSSENLLWFKDIGLDDVPLVGGKNASLGELYRGKVRDNFAKGGRIVMVTTDRLSAFDRVLTTIPFKGEVLNQITAFWFEKTKDVAPNHLQDVPDPSVLVVRRLRPLSLEMVVRGYLTGSLWRDFQAGRGAKA